MQTMTKQVQRLGVNVFLCQTLLFKGWIPQHNTTTRRSLKCWRKLLGHAAGMQLSGISSSKTATNIKVDVLREVNSQDWSLQELASRSFIYSVSVLLKSNACDVHFSAFPQFHYHFQTAFTNNDHSMKEEPYCTNYFVFI